MIGPIDLAIAQYPGDFRECMVTKDKICMQFNEVPTKLRLLGHDAKQLPKGVGSQPYVPLTPEPKSFGISAVGCYMPVLESTQEGLVTAYKEYLERFSEEYKLKYNKDFKEFLIKTRDSINEILGE